MRWKFRNRVNEISNWHPWYAWHPVVIGKQKVWLETVWRRGRFHYGGMDCFVEHEYSLEKPE